jgi:hypothetical protein
MILKIYLLKFMLTILFLKMSNMKIIRKLPIAIASVAMMIGSFSSLSYATGATVVYPSNTHGWNFTQEDYATGTGSFVEGPGTTPLGTGSAEFTVDSTGRELLYNTNYAGTRLDQITSLKYSTYSQTPTTVFAPSLQFDVDYNLNDTNTAWQGRLVYEPYMSGTVTSGVWQTWNPLNGVWWATKAPGSTLCPQSNPCTWSQILTAFPDAGIGVNNGVDKVSFKVGGPWTGGYTGNVDAFTIGINNTNTIYDFESHLIIGPPTSKDQCKSNGWETFNNPSFRNQGQCVSYFNHNS